MILIFGGTTEGRTAVKVLDEAGSPTTIPPVVMPSKSNVSMEHGLREAWIVTP